jgi:class 3 adenylate cyclase
MQQESGYALVGRERIAYQVTGTGPRDLVLVPGSFGNIDVSWEDPVIARIYRRIASFCRLILFDRRGSGASDPVPLDALPPWESYMEEVEAVMDEVGSSRAAIMGAFDAGPMAALFAATKPERTTALILINTSARWVVADDYPIGVPEAMARQAIEGIEAIWGTEAQAWTLAPSQAGDERFRRWFAKFTRSMITPTELRMYLQSVLEADARAILPTIHVPTLVMHRTNLSLVPIAQGRYVAERIPGARFVEIPGADAAVPWEHGDLVFGLVEEFLTGVQRRRESERVLTTVLFTDIVSSTERVRELGDRRWKELLDTHDDVARTTVDGHQGRLIETTGDSILATFDGPGRGIRCATSLRDALSRIGLSIRAGLHTGEVELRGERIGGITVHVGARVMATAGEGEILVSRTVRDLIAGSEIELEDRGLHPLKGVEGDWQLFAVIRG